MPSWSRCGLPTSVSPRSWGRRRARVFTVRPPTCRPSVKPMEARIPQPIFIPPVLCFTSFWSAPFRWWMRILPFRSAITFPRMCAPSLRILWAYHPRTARRPRRLWRRFGPCARNTRMLTGSSMRNALQKTRVPVVVSTRLFAAASRHPLKPRRITTVLRCPNWVKPRIRRLSAR